MTDNPSDPREPRPAPAAAPRPASRTAGAALAGPPAVPAPTHPIMRRPVTARPVLARPVTAHPATVRPVTSRAAVDPALLARPVAAAALLPGTVLAGAATAPVLIRQGMPEPVRRRVPADGTSRTRAFTLGGASGHLIAGLYPDGRVGEVFMVLGRPGSTLAGLMGAFSVCVSLSLQHGVPLQTWVEQFTNMRFEPAGATDDPDIPQATSLVDYMFRRLALDHLAYPVRAAYGILTAAERAAPPRVR